MSKVKLNQCQDCGCPGSQIQIVEISGPYRARGCGKSPKFAFSCPYCKRTAEPLVFLDPDVKYDLIVLIERWNSMNRDNEEGLA